MGSLNGLDEAMAADRKAALDLHLELQSRGLTKELVQDFVKSAYEPKSRTERWEQFGGRQEYNRIREEVLNLPSDVWQKVAPPAPEGAATNYMFPSGRQGTILDEQANRAREMRPDGAAGSALRLAGEAAGASPQTKENLAQLGNNVGDLGAAAAGVKAGRDANRTLSEQTPPRPTTTIQRAYQSPAPGAPPGAVKDVKDGKVPPQPDGPRPAVTEGKVPARTEPAGPAKTGPAKTETARNEPARNEPAKTETVAPGAKEATGPTKPDKPAVGTDAGPGRMPRTGSEAQKRHVDRAFDGQLQAGAPPSKEKQTVDAIVDKIGERAADKAVKDGTFQRHEKAGDVTAAGTRFHTLAKQEADTMVRNGEVPKGYEVSAELTVKGQDGYSRLDVLVKAPDGTLHERDWKPTVMSGLGREIVKPGGEMDRHQQHTESATGQRPTSQESRSWAPLVRQAENREAKRTADANTATAATKGDKPPAPAKPDKPAGERSTQPQVDKAYGEKPKPDKPKVESPKPGAGNDKPPETPRPEAATTGRPPPPGPPRRP